VLLVYYFANFEFGMNINSSNSQRMIVRKNWDLGLSFHVSTLIVADSVIICYVLFIW